MTQDTTSFLFKGFWFFVTFNVQSNECQDKAVTIKSWFGILKEDCIFGSYFFHKSANFLSPAKVDIHFIAVLPLLATSELYMVYQNILRVVFGGCKCCYNKCVLVFHFFLRQRVQRKEMEKFISLHLAKERFFV